MALWRNVTDRVRQEEKSKLEETIRTDQKLSNYIQQGHLTKALKICLRYFFSADLFALFKLTPLYYLLNLGPYKIFIRDFICCRTAFE